VRSIEYRNIISPSVAFLERCGRLMIDAKGLAEFLGVPSKVVMQLGSSEQSVFES
jgi:hypothetical protein